MERMCGRTSSARPAHPLMLHTKWNRLASCMDLARDGRSVNKDGAKASRAAGNLPLKDEV